MRHILVVFCLSACALLHAQTPIISQVNGEAGANTPLCPGGVGFIQGTNLTGPVVIGGKQAFIINTFQNTSIQFQVPVDLAVGATTIKAGTSTALNLTLTQYCPGMPTNPPSQVATAFHLPNFEPVTATFPSTPNEKVAVLATGLGATNPVYATGTAPDDDSAQVAVKPQVTVDGKPVNVARAYLSPNNPGFYVVEFTTPSDISTGNHNLNILAGGLSSNTTVLLANTGAVISSISNAASYITVGPRKGIAQGSIFVVKGLNMGPANLVISPAPFQTTSIGGTSITITVNGANYQALMYYSSATQLAAVLPSNVPTGAATVTATYNNLTGPPVPFNVVASSPGIFTITSDGNGAGIVTNPDYSLVSTTRASNCGGVYTTCGAANPGDVLIIWATGLGPVNGTDSTGAGLGVNMSNLGLTVWLGEMQITPSYAGRSGCCIAEDQIVFTVPPNAPAGCAVPLTLQVGTTVSNTVLIPVANTGSRTCTPVNPAFPTSAVTQTAANSSFNFGFIGLSRRDKFFETGTAGFEDKVDAQFLRLTIPTATQPFFMSLVDVAPLGTCRVFNTQDGEPDPPISALSVLNAGAQLVIQNANGTKNVPLSAGEYSAVLSSTGNYFVPGTLNLSMPGGSDLPAFNTSITVPAAATLVSPAPDNNNNAPVTRTNGLQVLWNGGAASGFVELSGSFTNSTRTGGVSFQCVVPSTPGNFTIPARVLEAFPPDVLELHFNAAPLPVSLPLTGLTLSQLILESGQVARVTLQ